MTAGDAASMQGPPQALRLRPVPALAGLVLVAATFAGCVSTPPGGPPGGRAPPSAAGQGGVPPSAMEATRRGGGYYLDDGPGDRGPAELEALAALPEPVPVAEPLHPRANRPYRVMGNDYEPMIRRELFLQRGVASWYGRKFHGRLTSVGERYDMYQMTAAHPTLPIPSFVRVSNLENGRSVVVRVNDRGPFLHGRVIDLSFLAAYKLGYVDSGSAPVEVELLDPSRLTVPSDIRPPSAAAVMPASTAAERPPAAAPAVSAVPAVSAAPTVSAGSATSAATSAAPAAPAEFAPAPALQQTSFLPHYLQLGAFSARSNAEAASAHFRRRLDWLQVPIRIEPSGSLYLVQAGPYVQREQAADAGAQVQARVGLRPLLLPQPLPEPLPEPLPAPPSQ